MDPRLFLLLLPVPVGALIVTAAIRDWKVFFGSGNADRGLQGKLSRPVKRIVYAIGGTLIILVSVYIFYIAASAELSRV